MKALLSILFLLGVFAPPAVLADYGDEKDEKKEFPERLDLDRFRMIPVLYDSRVVPLDTFADGQLRAISSKAEMETFEGEKLDAVHWFADLLFKPAPIAFSNKVIELNNPSVAEAIDLVAEPYKRKYAMFDIMDRHTNATEVADGDEEFVVPYLKLIKRCQEADKVDSDFRTIDERAALNLMSRMQRLMSLQQSLVLFEPDINMDPILADVLEAFIKGPGAAPEDGGEDQEEGETEIPTYFELARILPALEARLDPIMQGREDAPEVVVMTMTRMVQDLKARLGKLGKMGRPLFLCVPVDPHGESKNAWMTPIGAFRALDSERGWMGTYNDKQLETGLLAWQEMKHAYVADDQEAFDTAVDNYLTFIAQRTELLTKGGGHSDTLLGIVSKLKLGGYAYLFLGTLLTLLFAFCRGFVRRVGLYGLLLLHAGIGLFLCLRLYGDTHLAQWAQYSTAIGLGAWLLLSLVGLWVSRKEGGPIRTASWMSFLAVLFALAATGLVVLSQQGGWGIDIRPTEALAIESAFNQSQYFYWARTIYVFTFIVALAAVISQHRIIRNAAAALFGIAFLYHVLGLDYRMFITARPPVYNLYATYLFVGLLCVLLGLAIEWFLRNSMGVLLGSAAAFGLLLYSGIHLGGDTMGELQPVLRTQFWLSSHVITIMFGYAGVFFAGLVGHIYLLTRIFGKTAKQTRPLFRALIGILAFGLTFSFLGTMLGGVWADQSWGRFWGWDPKENGALIIVLYTALMFHARMANMIREIGMAVMSVLGCVVVMWSWEGLNLLGVGLHSYGFTSGTLKLIVMFSAGELGLAIVLGLVASIVARRTGRKPPVPAIAG